MASKADEIARRVRVAADHFKDPSMPSLWDCNTHAGLVEQIEKREAWLLAKIRREAPGWARDAHERGV